MILQEITTLIKKKKGLEAFYENENENAENAMNEGPFAKLLKTLSKIKEKEDTLVKIAIVTARNSPAHKRVILTLRKWGCKVDEMFFLGGVAKDKVLKAFNAHIFFDDQDHHVGPASHSMLNQLNQNQEQREPSVQEHHEGATEESYHGE